MPMNKEDELGALWLRTSKKDGRTFLTGKIGSQEVVVFQNDRKKNEKEPDYRIYRSQPREQS